MMWIAITMASCFVIVGFLITFVIYQAERERARHYREYVERNRRDRTFEDKGNEP